MTLHVAVYSLLEALGVVFLRLLNMSIAAGVVILLVMAIRRLFPHMPKWLRCLLWALPALRLIPLPFSLPNPFSLAPGTDTVYEVRTAASDGGVTVPVLNSGWEAVDNAVNPALERSFAAAAEGAAAVTERARDFSPATFFGLLWAAGCAALLAYLLLSFLRFRRRVRPCVLYEKGVYLTDGVSSPFILGVLRPKIYLPSALPPEHYPAILAHERAHLKRKDHWWKPLGFLLLAVHWFNPLVWLGYALLCRDIEFACDERVIRDADAAAKKAYSEALLICGAPTRAAACPLAFGEVGVKARIQHVLRYRKPAVWIAVTAALAAAVAAFCFLTDRPAAWVSQWNSQYTTGKVYLDPVVSPAKASKYPSRTVILDGDNHLLVQYANGASHDYGKTDIGGEYLWEYVKEYAPAQYRNCEPQKSPEAVSGFPSVTGYATHYVIFRPKGNVFFFAEIAQTPDGYTANSLCRLTRVGQYVGEPLSSRWYVVVPVKGVRYFNVSGDFGNRVTYCDHWNKDNTAMTFDPGERVFLNGLDGMESVGGLTVTAYQSNHIPLYSIAVPPAAGDVYTDGQGWQVVRNDRQIPDNGASAFAVATAFLRAWFTSDAEGRYTRLHQKETVGEEEYERYFDGVRDYVTEAYYETILRNRGYHAYDRFAAEAGLSVAARGIQLETEDDETYTFTVHLSVDNSGANDHASGTLRMKDGKINWMRVEEITLVNRRQDGETPTSHYEDEETTARHDGEWTTAVPPEEFSTAAEVDTAVDADLIDYLHIPPALLPLAEQALQPVGRSTESGGVRVTVTQALHYPTVIGAVVSVEFEPDLLQNRPAGDLWRPDVTLTVSDETADESASSCVVIRQEAERVVYFFRLFRGGTTFAPGMDLTLTINGFAEAQGDFSLSLSRPLTVSWRADHVAETVRAVAFSAADGFTGTAVLTPLSLQIEVSPPFPDGGWVNDILLRDTDNRPIEGLSCQTETGVKGPSLCNVGLTAFLDPDAVGWLWIGGRQMQCRDADRGF